MHLIEELTTYDRRDAAFAERALGVAIRGEHNGAGHVVLPKRAEKVANEVDHAETGDGDDERFAVTHAE
jgi:hypothetical protein